MELLEKLPEVTVKGDGAESVKHVSSGSAKQIRREDWKKHCKVVLSREVADRRCL